MPISWDDKADRDFMVALLVSASGGDLQSLKISWKPVMATMLEMGYSAVGRQPEKKPVKVYHFVTAHTFEVDLLELRKRSHVLVAEDQAVGRFHPVPADTDANGEAPNTHNSLQAADDDIPMNDSAPAVDAKEFDDLYDVSDDRHGLYLETKSTTLAANQK